MTTATKAERKLINGLVKYYRENQTEIGNFLEQLRICIGGSEHLKALVHSFKWRLKEPEHLKDKLFRKLDEAKQKRRKFRVTKDNLFTMINDLAGGRVLHLHTRQTQEIDRILKEIFDEARLGIVEGPFARTWDDETKTYFENIGIETRESGPSMYTSVHYIIDSNSRTRYTAEIQVRTLAEELWGEVGHVIDYPKPCRSPACREQLRVLARVASSCTRLVDAIFHTHADYIKHKTRRNS